MDKNKINIKNISLIVVFFLVVLWLGGFIVFSTLGWTFPTSSIFVATIGILLIYSLTFLLARLNLNDRILIGGIIYVALSLPRLIVPKFITPSNEHIGIISYISLIIGIVMILIGVIRKKNDQSNI